MGPGDIAAIVMSVVACFGLGATWIKNGRQQARELGNIQKDIEALQKEVSHSEHGLGKIKEAVDAQIVHCARVSTELSVRVQQLEKESKKNQK